MDILLNHTDERGAATLTLNRPEVHNAFNAEVISTLHKAFTVLGASDKVRAIVLKGAGKSFSAGADLNWMKDAANFSHAENMADAMALSDMLEAIATCPKPVLVVAHGAVMGGGVGLVAAADIAIAQEGAIFALSEVKLGLTPATISPYVVRAMGARHCQRLFMTGERFNATEAMEFGLVSDVIANTDAEIENLLGMILKNGPEAMASTKGLIRGVSDKPIDDEMRKYTASEIADRRTSAEGQEGLSAFFDKRKPKWAED